MKLKSRIRKEKDFITRKISKAQSYKDELNKRLFNLSRHYREGKISREDYYNAINYGLDGRSFKHYLAYYNTLIKENKGKVGELDEKLQGTNNAMVVFAALFVLVYAMFMFNPGITGMVVFSDLERTVFQIGEEYSEDTVLDLSVPEGINTFMVSGEYNGEGGARIYLVSGEDEWLVYSDDRGGEFKQECGNACYLSNEYLDYNLRIEVEGSLRIDNIEYSRSELREFLLKENNETFNINENRFVKGKVTVQNTMGGDIKLGVYGEGELTKYLTLYSSYVEVENSTEIMYDIDLPLDITPGKYTETIILRYLPEYEFTGNAPVEEFEITVNVEQDRVKGFRNISYVIIFLAVLFVVNIFIFSRFKIG